MPVVVPEDAWARWLTPTTGAIDELIGLFEPNETVGLRIQAVSRLVNDVRQDGPALVEPLEATA
jgi:putative SOS response-associated peptidase YedK